MRYAVPKSESTVEPPRRQTRSMTKQQKANANVNVNAPVSPPPKPVKGKVKAKAAPKRASQPRREAKLKSASLAAKRLQKKKKRAAGHSFCYVGNLQAGITETRLEAYFIEYGPIFRIQIRCSGGQAVSIGTSIPGEAKGRRDRQYASIEFNDTNAARKALQRNGFVLDGIPLVVSLSAGDLPEVQDIVKSRHGEEGNPLVTGHTPDSQRVTVQQRLPQEPTELLVGHGKSGPDRLRFLGFSFAPTVI
ncbi:translation initiation factor [Coprinopsis cinerea AmutBmut pab1-1]|nr:translation initiation factor [Coprinopsis cinerea AmutBmut pab1-1]